MSPLRRKIHPRQHSGIRAIICSICIALLSSCTPITTKTGTTTTNDRSELSLAIADGSLVSHPGRRPQLVDRAVVSEQVSIVGAKYFNTHPAHTAQVNALVTTRDGKVVYSGAQDGTVTASYRSQLPNNAFQITSELLLSGEKPILALALSDDERRLAIAQFSSVVIYDLDSEELVAKMTRVKGRILSLAWDPRSEAIALGRANGDVFLWNLAHGKDAARDSERAIELYQGATSPVAHIVFHPSHSLV